MTNSPQENLTPAPENRPGGPTPDDPTNESLVEDVLRDARSLLGEPAGLVDPTGLSTSEVAGMLEGVEPESADRLVSPPDAIKRSTTARDLGSAGPQVDLFGADAQATPVPSAPATVSDEEDTPVTSTNPAAALEALMATRVAQESEIVSSVISVDRSMDTSMSNEGIASAVAPERTAVAAVDAMGGSAPLRSTAGEVDAVASGDPHPLPNVGDVRSGDHAVESTSTSAGDGVRSRPEDPAVASDPRGSTDAPDDPRMAADHGEPLDPGILPPSDEGVPHGDPVRTGDGAPSSAPSRISRLAALPFGLVPESMHGFVSVAAVSLALWVPVAWTFAFLDPAVIIGSPPPADVPQDPAATERVESSGDVDPPESVRTAD